MTKTVTATSVRSVVSSVLSIVAWVQSNFKEVTACPCSGRRSLRMLDVPEHRAAGGDVCSRWIEISRLLLNTSSGKLCELTLKWEVVWTHTHCARPGLLPFSFLSQSHCEQCHFITLIFTEAFFPFLMEDSLVLSSWALVSVFFRVYSRQVRQVMFVPPLCNIGHSEKQKPRGLVLLFPLTASEKQKMAF